MIKAIYDRRSIRKFKNKCVPKNLVTEILKAGIAAPSSKNRQPWKFIVVSGNAKSSMLSAMKKGVIREKTGKAFLPDSTQYIGGAENTMNIMEQAPVTIFIVNTLSKNFNTPLNAEDRIYEICNAQSIGASIENMTLAATELGLGSLWICDIFFAYEELNEWLGAQGDIIAALTIGYADEYPNARPRKSFPEAVEYRE